MIYLDTSYLVRLYFDDPGFPAVRELAASDHVCCALHGQAELVAAFHRKLREGAIPPRVYQVLLAQFAADEDAGAFQWLPAGKEVLARVREVYGALPRTTYLRGADAIHLATASVHGRKEIYSNDRHLLAAARNFGLRGVNLLAPD